MQSEHRSNAPVSEVLPRPLYWIIVGLAVWLIVSVWGFASKGYTGLVLSVVSLFIGIAVGLPLILAGIARRHRATGTGKVNAETLAEWLGREFDDHTGRLKGIAAAIQILLPLAAVAFGMTLFALVHHFDVTA
jgi:hypothetical protein